MSNDEATVLVLVAATGLRDEVRRAAAAAGRPVLPHQPPVTRHAWKRAPAVILDTASAARCVADRLPRRRDVTLVTATEPGIRDWQHATEIGAEQVLVLPDRSADLVESLGDYPSGQPGDGTVVAVIGGRGGAGASVFAAALALRSAAACARPHTLLIDGDPNGGGLDLLLGLEDQPGLRWPGLVVESGRVSAAALHHALPAIGPAGSVLSFERPPAPVAGHAPPDADRLVRAAGGMSTAAVESVLHASRDAGDLVICDVPRERTGQAEAMLEAADLVALVVPADLRSVMAAGWTAAAVGTRNVNQGLVIRGPAPGGLRVDRVAAALGLPLLAAMRPQPRLSEQLDQGGLRVGRGPLRRAADTVLDLLAQRPAPAIRSAA
jgi:secretion/DNA translocation related CpaE-like protein